MKKFFTLIGAVALGLCASAAMPEQGVWYRLLNQQGGINQGVNRDNTFLGYYPETQWYVYPKDAAGARSLGTNPFIAGCDLALEGMDGVTDAVIDGQMWSFVAGEGENAGKYCFVNKAYPDGAISNEIVDNNGNTTSNGSNPSRWKYVADRTADADKVCWFNLGDDLGNGVFQPTFANPVTPDAIYMALAASGQKFQIIRVNTGSEPSTKWQLVTKVIKPYIVPGETYSLMCNNSNDKVLGYYPESAGTQWTVYNKDNGSLQMGYNPFVCAGNLAIKDTDTPAQVNQQLWQFIPGEGDNEGKYAIVNTAFPDGAISNVPYNNSGSVVENSEATNASRWAYLADRTADADKVCWFTLAEFTASLTSLSAYITFEPLAAGYKYMQVAGPAQSKQVMRYNDENLREKWTFIPSPKAETTSIAEISTPANKAIEGIYDLQGRRVNAAAKGIFIINGKKVLVK